MSTKQLPHANFMCPLPHPSTASTTKLDNSQSWTHSFMDDDDGNHSRTQHLAQNPNATVSALPFKSLQKPFNLLL
ncbi:hypothetical protein RIF29_40804 [Crotalaria pallida]|uniref:Uncharacterized protein n=1 Tax=Crotalaria pallida TaxID=3830 RepID=A0AAN9E987_CROPI